VLVLVLVLVLEGSDISEIGVMVLCVFSKSIGRYRQSLENNILSSKITIPTHLAPSSSTELLCSKIDEVADSLTFLRVHDLLPDRR
jgi:hypothetical protein